MSFMRKELTPGEGKRYQGLPDEDGSIIPTPTGQPTGGSAVSVEGQGSLQTSSSSNPGTHHRRSPILEAVKHNNYSRLQELLHISAAEVSTVDRETGSTPLHWAIINGSVVITSLLIDKGANVSAKNNAGYQPIHCAAELGNPRLITMLVDKGADVESRNYYGHTPLHCAARWGRKNVVAQLIKEYGVGTNVRDKNKWTPLHFASFNGYVDLARFLIE
eukprot:TRINITY_DN9572_c0_g1_i3.p1 TRINITY_DN9572_c0_g1~~TRINITY_DN9572_c0_g1_i3.p1  ORF type:complete len:236 (+),score=31.86 TRINITY_DN9572_c0_g1_i3:57-710(+)